MTRRRRNRRGSALVEFALSFSLLFTLFAGAFQFDAVLLRRQLAYALPFGMAVLVEILQANLPAYVVSLVFVSSRALR